MEASVYIYLWKLDSFLELNYNISYDFIIWGFAILVSLWNILVFHGWLDQGRSEENTASMRSIVQSPIYNVCVFAWTSIYIFFVLLMNLLVACCSSELVVWCLSIDKIWISNVAFETEELLRFLLCNILIKTW